MRKMPVQNGGEAIVMMTLNQVRQSVRDDVFQTLHRLLGKFEDSTKCGLLRAARSPFRFHSSYPPVGQLNPKDGLPFYQKRRDSFP